jgi:hypothetical protein
MIPDIYFIVFENFTPPSPLRPQATGKTLVSGLARCFRSFTGVQGWPSSAKLPLRPMFGEAVSIKAINNRPRFFNFGFPPSYDKLDI